MSYQYVFEEPQHKAISISSGTATVNIVNGTAGKRYAILAMKLTTEAADGDIDVEDTDSNSLGFMHMGTGTGGSHHDEIRLGYNPAGWFVSPEGKGLQLSNVDDVDIEGIVIYAAIVA